MKRVIIAVLLLCTVCLLCVLENKYINSYCTSREKAIESCEKLYNSDKELCIKKTAEFKKEWNKKQTVLILFVNHGIIDEITKESAKLATYAEMRDEGEYFASCALIKHCLKQIKTDERITFDTFY